MAHPKHSFNVRAGLIPLLLAFTSLASAALPAQRTLLRPAAEQPSQSTARTLSSAPVPDDPLERGTPRSTVERFFGAARENNFPKAAQYLDLTGLPEDKRSSEGPRLARQLWFVLERQTTIDFSSLSIDPLGETSDGLPPNRERLAQIVWPGGVVDINLERLPESDTLQVWKVSSRSVEEIPRLYASFRLKWAERLFSEPTFNWVLRTHFLGLALFTWMGLLWSVCIWAIAVYVCIKIGNRLLRLVPVGPTLNLLSAIYVPLIVILVTGIMRSIIPQRAVSAELSTILRGRTILVAVSVWICFRIVDFCAERARAKLFERDGNTGFHLIDLLRRVAKVALVVLALIVWLDNLGFRVSTIVASLGIIGLAVGLASQKFIEDLIAAMTLHATGVVKRNEAIGFGDKRGVVEDIGLRMIKIRSRDRTLITMPNASFAALQIENFGRRDRIPFRPHLGLRYETTPDQLRYVLIELRKLLYAHPRVINDSARVRFEGFGPSSLDIAVHCYIDETDYAEYLAIAEDLNLRIMDIVARAGTGFAFPSQTVYFERGQRPDRGLSQQAEAEVRLWREQGELFQHEFSEEAINRLNGTLKYPDPGTPGRPKESP